MTPHEAVEPQTQHTVPQSTVIGHDFTARLNLSNREIQELEELITELKDIFVSKSSAYGQTNRVYHHIDAGGACLVQQPPRRCPLAKQAEMDTMLQDMQ
jgi:hypothetical protein